MRGLIIVLLLGCCAFSCALASDVTRGNQVDAVIRDSTPLYEDSDVCARVAEIGQKVVAASGNESGLSFHFYVLNSPDATTFSSPNGSVYVTTGLLRHLQSKDELAVMLAHEIGHVNMRHMMKTEASERDRKIWGYVIAVSIQAAGAFAGAAVQVQTAKGLSTTYAIVPNGRTPAYSVTNRGPDRLIYAQNFPSQPKYAFLQQDQAGAQLAGLTSRAVEIGTAHGGEALLNLFYVGYKDEYEFAADRAGMKYAEKAGYNGSAMVSVLDRLSGNSAEIDGAEIAHLHSSRKTLAARTADAKGEAAAPPQN